MSDLPTSGGYAGQQGFQTPGAQQNSVQFLVERILAGRAHASLVQVLAVHGGGLAPPPTVDVQPLVDQIDGQGNRYPHGTVYGLPVLRLGGGKAAIVCDPKVGDIGIAIFCDRDISIVKATKARSGPASRRQNNWCDGVYLGSLLGSTPTQYIEMSNDGTTGISILSPGSIDLKGSGGAEIDINGGTIAVKGVLTVNGTIVTVP
jgi:hypothetical protein